MSIKKGVIITRDFHSSYELWLRVVEIGALPILLPAYRVDFLYNDELTEFVLNVMKHKERSRKIWFVFTSRNAVLAFFDNVKDLISVENAMNFKWAAIGPTTQFEILSHFITPTVFMPTRESGKALAKELPIQNGDIICYIRGLKVSGDFKKELLRRDVDVEIKEFITYETPYLIYPKEAIRTAIENSGVIVFTSASTVEGFILNVSPDELQKTDIKTIAMGKSTIKKLGDIGLEPTYKHLKVSDHTWLKNTLQKVFTKLNKNGV